MLLSGLHGFSIGSVGKDIKNEKQLRGEYANEYSVKYTLPSGILARKQVVDENAEMSYYWHIKNAEIDKEIFPAGRLWEVN